MYLFICKLIGPKYETYQGKKLPPAHGPFSAQAAVTERAQQVPLFPQLSHASWKHWPGKCID